MVSIIFIIYSELYWPNFGLVMTCICRLSIWSLETITASARLLPTTQLLLGTKPGLWTIDWTLDYGLDYGLDYMD